MKNLTIKISKKTPFVFGWIVLLFISLLQLFGVTHSVASHFAGDAQAQTVVVPENDKCMADSSDKLVPSRITMKSVGIDLPVVSVPFANGTWKVNSGVANYAEGTSYISEKDGNVGIFAHDLENGFANIKDLKNGDEITVVAGSYTASYRVVSGHKTHPSDVQTFFPTKKPTLTLITCEGFISEKRYVIKAELISVSRNDCDA